MSGAGNEMIRKRMIRKGKRRNGIKAIKVCLKIYSNFSASELFARRRIV